MARILLTGATGLIGRSLTRTLVRDGHEVLAVSRRGLPVPGATMPGVAALACDLLDPADRQAMVARAGAEALVHLAWHDGPKDRWISAANLDWMRATIALV